MKSCACCGIRELVEKKPNEIGAYTSKEYQWTVHTTNEKEFLEQFAFIEGTEPLGYIQKQKLLLNGDYWQLIHELINEPKTFRHSRSAILFLKVYLQTLWHLFANKFHFSLS